eukprot:804815-Pelagomonas_calceolata.AAC.16
MVTVIIRAVEMNTVAETSAVEMRPVAESKLELYKWTCTCPAGIILSSMGVLMLATLSFMEIVELLNGEWVRMPLCRVDPCLPPPPPPHSPPLVHNVAVQCEEGPGPEEKNVLLLTKALSARSL